MVSSAGAAAAVSKGSGKLSKGGSGLNKGMEMLTGSVSMNHHFVVRIDRSAYDLGTWQSVAGLKVKWAKCEYRPSEQGNTVHIWPGVPNYDNITLARAACSDSMTVQKWLAENATNPAPLSGVIQLMDWLGFQVVGWTLRCFFPVSWNISSFNATDGKPAIESLELAHTGFLADKSI